MTTRAAVYTRVSSEEQASGGTSLTTQEERARAYCAARGWTVRDTYVDAGVSGAKASRPGLDRLLADVRAGQIDVVVIAKLDRLGRSLRHLAPMLGEMDDRGVALVSVAETFDSGSASGRLLRGILSSFAEHERDVIRERTRGGVAKRVAAGGWGGGDSPPYGYRVDRTGEHPRLVVDEREAEMIRLAVRLAVDSGQTCGQIATTLTHSGTHPGTRRSGPRRT